MLADHHHPRSHPITMHDARHRGPDPQARCRSCRITSTRLSPVRCCGFSQLCHWYPADQPSVSFAAGITSQPGPAVSTLHTCSDLYSYSHRLHITVTIKYRAYLLEVMFFANHRLSQHCPKCSRYVRSNSNASLKTMMRPARRWNLYVLSCKYKRNRYWSHWNVIVATSSPLLRDTGDTSFARKCPSSHPTGHQPAATVHVSSYMRQKQQYRYPQLLSLESR